MPKKRINVGGQAVIEGVMIRSPNYVAVSVRNEKGKIITKKDKIKEKPKFFKLMFVRGIVNLIEMLVIGIKSIIWSGNQQTDEKEDEFKTWEIVLTLFLSIGFAVLFFIALPYFLTLILGVKEEARPVFFNLIDGIIKIAIFLTYIYLISLMKDVKRLFQYHGAEHKAVHCYEANEKLTVKNCRKHSTLHSRCGTSFLMIVLVISILLFSLLPVIVIRIYPSFLKHGVLLQKSILFPLRLLFIPIIAGISYELLKLSSRFEKNSLIKIIVWPGLLLQKLTTRKPNKAQIEVAIVALKQTLNSERTKTI